jgi:hypothetical protein
MLAACVHLPDAVSNSERMEWARNLGYADRRTLLRAMQEHSPGPRLEEVRSACAGCGAEVNVQLDWASLLLG